MSLTTGLININFKEFLIEENILNNLNEIFDLNSDYIQVSTNVYIDYWKEFLLKADPTSLDNPLINLERTVKEEHGPRVKYFLSGKYLIFFGKFKNRNRYEIHFWDVENLEWESTVNKSGFGTIFSTIMSIIKKYHIDKEKVDKIYFSHGDLNRLKFYKKIIDKMCQKYNIHWNTTINNELVFHHENDINEGKKIMKPSIYKLKEKTNEF